MLRLPRALVDLIHRLQRLPGVGPKAAERMALALLNWDSAEASRLAAEIVDATSRVTPCPSCGCLSQDGEECSVCSDPARDTALICVVESALDAIAMERGGSYSGLYHVLGGALSPMRGVLPEDLNITSLIDKVGQGLREVIIATNASPDGEATALYLRQALEEARSAARDRRTGAGSAPVGRAGGPGAEIDPALLRITRLARGLPSGGQLDYIDAATLKSAIEHRTEF